MSAQHVIDKGNDDDDRRRGGVERKARKPFYERCH